MILTLSTPHLENCFSVCVIALMMLAVLRPEFVVGLVAGFPLRVRVTIWCFGGNWHSHEHLVDGLVVAWRERDELLFDVFESHDVLHFDDAS